MYAPGIELDDTEAEYIVEGTYAVQDTKFVKAF